MKASRMAIAALLAVSLPAVMGCKGSRLPGFSSPDTRPFIDLARQSPCADLKNRLFVIDEQLVFMDQAGNCADAAYTRTLFGATPEQVLCRNHDSIAGPRKECGDPLIAPMFDIILANLDQPDLGLGPGHTVRPVPF